MLALRSTLATGIPAFTAASMAGTSELVVIGEMRMAWTPWATKFSTSAACFDDWFSASAKTILAPSLAAAASASFFMATKNGNCSPGTDIPITIGPAASAEAGCRTRPARSAMNVLFEHRSLLGLRSRRRGASSTTPPACLTPYARGPKCFSITSSSVSLVLVTTTPSFAVAAVTNSSSWVICPKRIMAGDSTSSAPDLPWPWMTIAP